MMKKMLLMFAVLCFGASAALAAVDVNTADQAALDSIAGVGPTTSKAIIDERDKHGNNHADCGFIITGHHTPPAFDTSPATLSQPGSLVFPSLWRECRSLLHPPCVCVSQRVGDGTTKV